VTVTELLAQWLDLVQDRLSPTTMTNYRGYACRYIADGIGRKRLRKVTPRDLDSLYQALGLERGLSARTIGQVHAILRGSFGQAVRWGWIRSNPAASASPPPVRKADIHPPTPEIAVRLLAEADAWDAEYAVFLRRRRGGACTTCGICTPPSC